MHSFSKKIFQKKKTMLFSSQKRGIAFFAKVSYLLLSGSITDKSEWNAQDSHWMSYVVLPLVYFGLMGEAVATWPHFLHSQPKLKPWECKREEERKREGKKRNKRKSRHKHMAFPPSTTTLLSQGNRFQLVSSLHWVIWANTQTISQIHQAPYTQENEAFKKMSLLPT